MNNPDEAIDRVLAGLRGVEAPVGLERRVLAAMEERAAERPGWRAPRGWVVGLAVAIGLVVGVLVVRPGKVPAAKVPAAKMGGLVAGVQVEEQQRRDTGGIHSVQDDVRFRGGLDGTGTGNRKGNGKGNRRSLRDDKQGFAAHEAFGYPAPPMPLTEQEKLLLRVAHRSDPTELTPLNAEARARMGAEFDQEFQEFFAVPKMVTDEKQTDPTLDERGEGQ